MTDQIVIPPPPPPPPPAEQPRGWVQVSDMSSGTGSGTGVRVEGGIPGSDRDGVDRANTLSTQALAPQVASAPPGGPSVDTSAGRADRRRVEADQRRAERAAARVEKLADKRARRVERTEFLRRPVPVDRSWAKWVAGGLILASACGFVWRVSERHQPIVVVNSGQQAQATTATSSPGPVSNPLQGIGHPVSSLAAAVIGSYDPAGRTVTVATSSGDLHLGAGRIEDLAGQVWAFGPTDPCQIYITSPDPRLSPKAVKVAAGQTPPAGATPLFDCSAPAAGTATTKAAGE